MRVNQVDRRPTLQLTGGDSEHVLERGAPEADHPSFIHDRHDVQRVLDQRPVVPLTGADSLGRRDLARDVPTAPQPANDDVAEHLGIRGAVDDAAVGQSKGPSAPLLSFRDEAVDPGLEVRAVFELGRREVDEIGMTF